MTTTAQYVALSTVATLSGASLSVPEAARPVSWAADLATYATENQQGGDTVVWPVFIGVHILAPSLGVVLPADADLRAAIYATAAALAASS
jgi:hypothetical protein